MLHLNQQHHQQNAFSPVIEVMNYIYSGYCKEKDTLEINADLDVSESHSCSDETEVNHEKGINSTLTHYMLYKLIHCHCRHTYSTTMDVLGEISIYSLQ